MITPRPWDQAGGGKELGGGQELGGEEEHDHRLEERVGDQEQGEGQEDH